MFVYVFDTKARDMLLGRGFSLIKEDPYNGLWVFQNSMNMLDFSLDAPCVVSDTLTF